MATLGKLERISNLRQIWVNEARDFTSWLAKAENLELLGDAIDMDLELLEQESSVGAFNVDIYAQDPSTGRKVIIENQLEQSDHDHLGKIITYASGKDAEVIVWIVKRVREEHAQAIAWLNEHTDSNIGIFLIEIELWRIGNSPIAPKFNIVERPNEWTKTQRQSSGLPPTQRQQLDFWQFFADNAFINDDEFSRFFKRVKPRPQNSYDLSLGTPAYFISLRLNSRSNVISIAGYIRNNKDLYEQFHQAKDELQSMVDIPVKWSVGKRDSVFTVSAPRCDMGDNTRWPEYLEWFKRYALKFGRFMKDVDPH